MNLIAKWLSKITSQKKDAERRQEERAHAFHDYVIEFQRQGHSANFIATGRDISLSGVRFATMEKLEKGETIMLTFHFSKSFLQGRDVLLKAAVVHSVRPRGARRWRVGCHFVSATATEQEILRDFMTWTKSRSVDPPR